MSILASLIARRSHTLLRATNALPSFAASLNHRAMASAGAPAGTAPSIIDAIKADHARGGIMAHCHAVQDTTAAHALRENARHKLVHNLSVHSLSEEEVLYPALRRAFGKEIRDHVLDEHTDLKKILLDIDKMDVTHAELVANVGHLASLLGHHMKEEEEEVLPAFAARVAADELAELGEKFERAKGRVPTRPHTWAPDKPATGNIIADRLTAPLDKARDKLAGRDV